MKSVLISIRPKWCRLIVKGEKTIEIRKTCPTIETPFKCYIYCTKEHSEFDCLYLHDINHGTWYEPIFGNGKVIGEFTCNQIRKLKANNGIQTYFNGIEGTCLRDAEIIKYASGKMIYYWHISDLVIYDKPKELSEFTTSEYVYGRIRMPGHKMGRPPQSWCYVEELQ